MGIFRFKRFSVRNERSAMKVNTDGVLLGASMTLLQSDRRLLDIGTGTGTIALMAAQRLSDIAADRFRPDAPESGSLSMSETHPELSGCSAAGYPFEIIAIDIDEASAAEAAENFAASPWTSCLEVRHVPLENFDDAGQFDMIFSNPPYFETSLRTPDGRRRTARHAETMSYREILSFSAGHLSPDGRLAMILPVETENELVRSAALSGFYPFRILRVRSLPQREPYRIVAEFSRAVTGPSGVSCPAEEGVASGLETGLRQECLVIQDAGVYTPEYRALTSGFLLDS